MSPDIAGVSWGSQLFPVDNQCARLLSACGWGCGTDSPQQDVYENEKPLSGGGDAFSTFVVFLVFRPAAGRGVGENHEALGYDRATRSKKPGS